MRVAHMVAVGPDARSLADERDIDMHDGAAALLRPAMPRA